MHYSKIKVQLVHVLRALLEKNEIILKHLKNFALESLEYTTSDNGLFSI